MARSLARTLGGSFKTDLATALGAGAGLLRQSSPGPLRLTRGSKTSPILLCYLRDAAALDSADPSLSSGHPNKWDSWLMANTLLDLGFDVHVIDWDDWDFVPKEEYSLVIALDANGTRLARLAPGTRPELVLHLTTAYPRFHNAAEMRRLELLKNRRGANLKARRQLSDLAALDRALSLMSRAALIGNEWTLSTYPEHVRDRIVTFNVTTTASGPRCGSELSVSQEERSGAVWFGGGGAVHKGLDLTLEALVLEPEIGLTVIGTLETERDFFLTYRRELFRATNISYEGYIPAGSEELDRILQTREFVIAPTCSESMSNALAYCLLKGLIPIYTPSAGLDIPEGIGVRIEGRSPEDVRSAARAVSHLSQAERTSMSREAAAFAEAMFSRERYATKMRRFLTEVTATLQ